MLDHLRNILVNQSDDLEMEWRERIATYLPDWDDQRLHFFVRELLAALSIFLLDQKKQAALKDLDAIFEKYFQSHADSAETMINSLLIFRYVLLAEMSKRKDCAVSSLEIFGFLNDLFNPLIIDLAGLFRRTAVVNRLPDEFAPSCVTNLQSLQFAGVGFFIIDASENIIYWSEGVERIYSLPAHKVIGLHVLEALPEWRSQARLESAIDEALLGGQEQELHSIKLRGDNKKLILDIKFIPLLNDREELVGCSVLLHDVTELKSRESELHKYEQYFENILNDAADAIILLNENHRITLWNKAAEMVFGYKETEVFGKTLAVIMPENKQAEDELARMDHAVYEKGVIRNHRLQAVARDGRTVLVEITRTALRNQRKDFIGSSVILRDITQQEQLRQQVFQSEKLSAVGTLAAGIAHEVGAPLTSISSLAQILQMKTDNQEFKEKLTLIQQSIDRISRTVRTLVDFSRPAAEKVEPIYLNNVIDHVLRIIKYDKRLKHQKIVTSLEPDIGVVRASFDQVLQVFINICLNAADAMEGKKDGVLEVKTWNNGKQVCVTIRDNGGGIPQKNLRHIFDPFFTTKKNGKGTGLGLWVSYNIIKSFSGDIKVESAPGRGATFTICLPRMES